GFNEALTNARRVIIAEEPQIIVNVASLEHLFIMKLIAWDEKYPERSKDASDMAIILKYYLEGENQQKLYDDDSDILEANDFDFETAAARILGRDISRFSTQKTLKYIGEIFERETNPEKEYRLARALINSTVYDDELEKAILLIDNIRQGIQDL
ncbi:MAG: hypothetical protein KAQ90_09360, partial [Melioribacteraceae bacterium]|nr:hypothetical protein [Melioribacteraceae bacterium]